MKSLVQYINEWKKDYIEDFGRICINSILNDIIDTLKKYPDATYSKLKKIVVATDSFTNR